MKLYELLEAEDIQDGAKFKRVDVNIALFVEAGRIRRQLDMRVPANNAKGWITWIPSVDDLLADYERVK